jgi:hypothetical protein
VNHRDIDLGHLPLTKLAMKLRLRFSAERNDQQTRGVHVQSVDCIDMIMVSSETRERRVLMVAPWNAEQARGLVDHDHVPILMNDLERPLGRIIGKGDRRLDIV